MSKVNEIEKFEKQIVAIKILNRDQRRRHSQKKNSYSSMFLRSQRTLDNI